MSETAITLFREAIYEGRIDSARGKCDTPS
jgi:hypothetical protein